MKKASFILGLIAGILGMISCGYLFFKAANTPMQTPELGKALYGIIAIAGISLLLQIAGLVFAILVESKSKAAGMVMIFASILDFISMIAAIPGDSLAAFLGCFVAFILFLIAGIFALGKEKQVKEKPLN